MNELILNGKSYLLSWLSKSPDKIDWTALTPYEAKVLQFCQRWLSGQDSFTLNSSGSTGPPKAINLSRNQMQFSAHLTGRTLGLQRGDRALVCLSTEYIAGMMMLVRGFELGLRLTIITPSSNPLADFPADTHFDFTALVPLQLQQVLTGTTDKYAILNRMKAILV
jgi:O-succinylbenzoic acid--CoA ligase